MSKRHLRIVKRIPPPAIGVCERCNAQFKSTSPLEIDMLMELTEAFTAHKCKPVDSSQNALRIVNEATERK
jgi:hypothetical protein